MPAADHKPPAGVKIAGTALEIDQVERIEVRNFVGLPDMATIRLADPEGTAVRQPRFKIGDPVEIKFGVATATSPEPVFKGEIVASEIEYSTASAYLSFRAYDVSHRLHRNRRSETFQDMTTKDIVEKVLGKLGVTAGQLESTPTVHKFMQQSMETDLDFVHRIAAADNCEFGIADGQAFLRRRRNGGGGTPEFAWRENALSFKPRMTAVQQHDTVRVVSYDPATKQTVVGEASTPTSIPEAARQARDGGSAFGGSELLIADRIATNQAEARQLAQSALDQLAGGSFEAEGTMVGNPAVKAGGKLKIKGFGAPYDGEHELTGVTHVYTASDYRTKFAISGRHPRTLTDLMRPKEQREWGANGLVIGLVTNNDDPDKTYRVRVKYPQLGDQVEGAWARIATHGAGKDRGFMFLPAVGDEVVLAFEHGDTRRPVVLGSLYNSKDKPGDKMLEGAPRNSAFVVHTPEDMEFDLGKEFAIKSKDKLTIELDGDYKLKSNKKVEVEAGTTVTIKGSSEVSIKSDAGIKIEAGGQLNLKGATVDINGTGGVTVKGSIINIG